MKDQTAEAQPAASHTQPTRPGTLTLTWVEDPGKMIDQLPIYSMMVIPYRDTYEATVEAASKAWSCEKKDMQLFKAVRRKNGDYGWAMVPREFWAEVVRDGDEIGVFHDV